MNLLNKLILWYIFVGILFTLIIHYSTKNYIYNNYLQLEINNLQNHKKTIKLVFEKDINRINLVCRDWAEWDSAYNFVDNFDTDFAIENFVPSTFEVTKTDYISYYKKNGQVYFPYITDDLKHKQNLFDNIVKKYILSFGDQKVKSLNGIIVVDNVIYLIALNPVLLSDESGNPNGYLLFLKAYEEEAIANLSDFVHSKVNVFTIDDFIIDNEKSLFNKIQEDNYFVNVIDNNFIEIFFILNGVNNSPALIVNNIVSRETFNEAQKTYLLILLNRIVTALLIFIVVYFINYKLFIKRLLKINNEIKLIGNKKKDFISDEKTFLNIPDEISYIKTEINDMLFKQKKSEEEILIKNEQLKLKNIELNDINSELENSNEELQVTTEELENNNEELKAATEELEATNEELQILNKELTQTNSEKEVLIREVHHRVKNNMQVIQSILNIQKNYIQNNEPAIKIIEECIDRVRSMALIHERLYQTDNLSSIDINQYIQNLIYYLQDAYYLKDCNVSFHNKIDNIYFSIEKALPVGLILNEIISNALKHAFKGKDTGNIYIHLSNTEQGRCKLSVKDDGVGLPEDIELQKNVISYGLNLVKIFANQLEADLSLNRTNGTEFSFEFDL